MEQKRKLIECDNVSKTFLVPGGEHQVVKDFHFVCQEN